MLLRRDMADASPSAQEAMAMLPSREGPSDEEILKYSREPAPRRWLSLGAFALAATLGVIAMALAARGGHSNADLDDHPALTALFDPTHWPDMSQVGAFEGAVRSILRSPGATVGTDVWVRVQDEAVVTVGPVASSGLQRLIVGAGPVHIVAVHHDPESSKVRAQLADGGWLSVFDLKSFHSFMDFHPWRGGCDGWLGARPPAPYLIGMDETAVTIGPTADTAVVAVLPLNQQVEVTEVYQDRQTGWRVRGRLADGAGWITLTHVWACEERAYNLPVPSNTAPARKGSFLVIGDWGWDPEIHWTVKKRQCQDLIAVRMLQKFQELGDVKFIINVGDSFYPNGVYSKDDPQWQTKWRDVYAEQLRSVPWYSVYGNHDMHVDPCACTQNDAECAQVNPDTGDRTRFYMPSPSYFVEHPELNTEVVGLDLNAIGDAPVCHYTTCEGACWGPLWRRFNDAKNLLNWRIKASPHKNMVIFSHYPSDYLKNHWDILGPLHDRRHSIVYLGGHRHSTDGSSVLPIWPHQSWVVGGGGGLSCDGAQGFLVGEIDMNDNIHTYPFIVPYDQCC